MSFKVGDRIKFGKDMGAFSNLIGTISYTGFISDGSISYYISVLDLQPNGDVFYFSEYFLHAQLVKPKLFHYSI